jgi:hypothetical protein
MSGDEIAIRDMFLRATAFSLVHGAFLHRYKGCPLYPLSSFTRCNSGEAELRKLGID